MGSKKRSRPTSKVVETALDKAKDIKPEEAKADDNNTEPENASNTEAETSSIKERSVKGKGPDTAASIHSRSDRGWYGGTWPRKAQPSLQVARESILVDKSKDVSRTVDVSRFESRKAEPPRPSTAVASPAALKVGKGQASTGPTLPELQVTDSRPSLVPFSKDSASEMSSSTKLGIESSVTPSSTIQSQTVSDSLDISLEIKRPGTSSGWLPGWLVGGGVDTSEGSVDTSVVVTEPTTETKDSKTAPGSEIRSETIPKVLEDKPASVVERPSTSWFGLWPSSTVTAEVKEETPDANPVPVMNDPEPTGTMGPTSPGQPAPGSSWAFWSKEPSAKDGKASSGEEQGELAIEGQPSQKSPAPAHADMPNPMDQILAADKIDKQKAKVNKSKLLDVEIESQRSSKSENLKSSPTASITPSKPQAPNLLLPSFDSTYRMKDSPSFMQYLAQLILHGRPAAEGHVYLVKDPPKIKKAVAIGIHGLFPAALLRTVIGQPTGTSIRFANHAATAISRWAASHDCDCEIEKIALEGEGKIFERVDNLWKLLLNWIDHVRAADFILVACHSQGVPVAMMLIEKLIGFGVVSSARIGVCAMAGVSLGPFVDYKSRFFGGSAAELFSFGDPTSEVSKRYESSLRAALNYGVRVTYVGSIDDQLISLESAIFASVDHPYIFRAVFVDGRLHAPDFIAHLVGFALKLRNLGVSDHGIIRELSVPLAGSLYTGGGHSSLYDEERIYDMAVAFATETTSIPDTPLRVQKYEAPTISNPFQLPWSMRGLLEEDIVKKDLSQEARDLLQQFDQWKPATKVLRDVKYRLEAVRSKL